MNVHISSPSTADQDKDRGKGHARDNAERFELILTVRGDLLSKISALQR